MSKIEINEGKNIFGALKLIEQLYLDGMIPGSIFRTILLDHPEIDISSFDTYSREKEACKCTD